MTAAGQSAALMRPDSELDSALVMLLFTLERFRRLVVARRFPASGPIEMEVRGVMWALLPHSTASAPVKLQCPP